MTSEQTDRIAEPIVIEVQRSETGVYTLNPRTAQRMDSINAMASIDAQRIERYGGLAGWGDWVSVYRVEDGDGNVRWYFGGQG